MKECLVSIIVPVYNVEEYLEQCLSSILMQDYSNIEVLVIDDGSTDKSVNICDKYKEKDKRVRVFHVENGGVSAARNIGLNNANGEYIMFVDSDDYVLPDYVSSLVLDQQLDIVQGGFFYDNISGRIGRQSEEKIIDMEKYQGKFLEFWEKNQFWTVWGCCYKKRIIDDNNLRFDVDMHYGEDTDFNTKYLVVSNKVGLTNKISYVHRKMQGTLSTTVQSEWLQIMKDRCQMMEKIDNVYYYKLRWRFWRNIIEYYQEAIDKAETREVKRKIKNKLKAAYQDKYFKECIQSIRKNGTLDEKLESMLMGYYRHYFYPIGVKSMGLVSRIKYCLNS